MPNLIDEVNLATMRDSRAIAEYAGPEYVLEHERVVFERLAPEVRGRRILDIGVGGGRTVRALRALSDDYLGIDYSEEMIAACRHRYPDVRFQHMDARRMDDVPDESITLAVFSCNGISMVGHEDRLAILREVRRVLLPGGHFVFTTYNLESPAATVGYRFPEFHLSLNPARSAVRAARWLRSVAVGLAHRRRLRGHEVRTPTYAIINDRCHDYGVMLYYISLAEQRRQLEREGFEADAPAYDCTGKLITDGTPLDSMLFVARKVRA